MYLLYFRRKLSSAAATATTGAAEATATAPATARRGRSSRSGNEAARERIAGYDKLMLGKLLYRIYCRFKLALIAHVYNDTYDKCHREGDYHTRDKHRCDARLEMSRKRLDGRFDNYCQSVGYISRLNASVNTLIVKYTVNLAVSNKRMRITVGIKIVIIFVVLLVILDHEYNVIFVKNIAIIIIPAAIRR